MFLGKKLLTIPIKNQYEQLCNAAALEELGGEIVYQIDQHFSRTLSDWIDEGPVLTLPEISDEEVLIQKIIQAGLGEKYRQESSSQAVRYPSALMLKQQSGLPSKGEFF